MEQGEGSFGISKCSNLTQYLVDFSSMLIKAINSHIYMLCVFIYVIYTHVCNMYIYMDITEYGNLSILSGTLSKFQSVFKSLGQEKEKQTWGVFGDWRSSYTLSFRHLEL